MPAQLESAGDKPRGSRWVAFLLRVMTGKREMRFRCIGVGVFLAGMFFSAGCGSGESGPERIAISGKVARAGSPLSNASISYLPTDGHKGPAATTGIEDGEYRFTKKTGPTAGPHRVVIRLSPPGKDLGPADPEAPAKGQIPDENPKSWEYQVDVPAEGPFDKDFHLE